MLEKHSIILTFFTLFGKIVQIGGMKRYGLSFIFINFHRLMVMKFNS